VKKNLKGFSLIEMAIVFAIIGLLMGGLLLPLSVQIDQQKFQTTKQELANIKESLIGFAIINDHFPCPDINDDGIEDTADCDIEGNLPWASLALDFARHDVWGNPYRYQVDKAYSSPPFPNPPKTSSRLMLPNLVSLEEDGASRILAIVYSSNNDYLIWISNNLFISRLVQAGKW
jgi:prepilin-type N-terminal cleavage/methylation domain-containing protein